MGLEGFTPGEIRLVSAVYAARAQLLAAEEAMAAAGLDVRELDVPNAGPATVAEMHALADEVRGEARRVEREAAAR